MAAYVQAAPQLRFSLALVELRLFEIPGESRRVVVPSIVARTEEVTRAVVSVSVDSSGDVQVDVSVPSDDSSESRGKLTEDEFFSELAASSSPADVDIARRILNDFGSRTGFVIDWGTASYIVKYRSPSDDRLLTLLVFTRDNKIYPGWLDQQLPKSGYELQIGQDFVRDLASAVGTPVNPKNPLLLDGSFTLNTFSDLYSEIDRLIVEFTGALDEAT